MAIKFHRCGAKLIKGPHPCWKVQKALDEAGIEYETVLHPSNPFARGKRTDLQELSGQTMLPVFELEDGTVIRQESSELVQMVRSGELQAAIAAAQHTPA